ncbi:MAG: hypothetical protein R3291_03415, partial [Thermoplasmata archaeon]|nr:hypothetical protein [Thermoplasmata archaeon]
DFPLASPRAPTEPVNVTFRVAVPLNTPANETVYMEWSSATLGSGSDPLTSLTSNRWIWEGRVTFSAPGDITYAYTRGAARVPENATRSLAVAYEDQVVTDGVDVWSDLPPMPLAPSFLQGVGPEDFWSVDFLGQYEAALDDIVDQNAEWVVVSSIWSYGRVDPTPLVEPRPLRAGSVFATTEDLQEVIARIHAHGLKAFIVPQFNMELTPGGDEVWNAHNNSWWAAWLDQARRLYLYNALVAEKAGVEMLLLPGPGFHVFFGSGWFTDPGYLPTFDARMQALIGEVRARYSGLLAVGGVPTEYDFPSLADFVGTTTFALTTPNLENRTVGAIRSDYDALLDSQTQPLFARWGRPVIFYQVALNGFGGTDTVLTPGHLLLQANAFEAFFQALWNRTWVEGMFTFGYRYTEVPLLVDASTRGKPASAVLAKYFGILPPG